MIKRRSRNKLFDTLHRGVVLACVGATLYGCCVLGYRFHKYWTVTRPQRKLREIEDSKHLLIEGREVTEAPLQDTAPDLKL
ncbi:hypothetical protein C0J52_19638 [Blattella germanica]|nr:hypothetical protein C0J52_19638 [Blattella germanica]